MIINTAGTVVVAIDDSSGSRAALRWAADYARATRTPLRAVHVLSRDVAVPVTLAIGLLGTPAAVLEQIRTNVGELFASVVPETSWTLTFLEGSANHEIVDCSRDARLLVVGAREHRGVGRLLVGSVNHFVLTHAECPVVAVPPAEGAAGPLVTAAAAAGALVDAPVA